MKVKRLSFVTKVLFVLSLIMMGILPYVNSEDVAWQITPSGTKIGQLVRFPESTPQDVNVLTMPAASPDTRLTFIGSDLNVTDTQILAALALIQTQVNKLSALDDVTLSDSTMVDTTLPDTATIVAVPIPSRCVGYSFSTESGTKFKWSKVSNMATYVTVQAGYPVNSYQEKGVFYAGTLYFKDSTSADTINIQFVIKP